MSNNCAPVKTISWLTSQGFDPSVKPMSVGGNNQLYIINDTQHQKFLLKKYINDQKNRLLTEWETLQLLHKNNFLNVAVPIASNQDLNIGIYNYISGNTPQLSDVDQKFLDDVLDFMSQLKKVKTTSKYSHLAPYFRTSYQDYLTVINQRLAETTDFTEIKSKLRSILNQMIAANQEMVNLKFTSEAICLSQVDYGIHNIIQSKGLHFIDFEYAGLDHIYKAPADFINHDSTYKLALPLKTYFINRYIEINKLTRNQVKSLNLSLKLINLEWVAIYLQAIQPAKINLKVKTGKLKPSEVDNFINKKLNSINERLTTT